MSTLDRIDLEAWAAARAGIRNTDGGRGYDSGVRTFDCLLCDDAQLGRARAWINVERGTAGCLNGGCRAEGGVPALEYVRLADGHRTKTEARFHLEREFPATRLRVSARTVRRDYDDWCALPPSTPLLETPSPKWGSYDEARAFVKRQWGLSLRDAERWGLRYCVQGRHAWRIIIPITMGRQLVGFQSRSYRNGEPKYLTGKHGPRHEVGTEQGRPAEALLFNIDAVEEGRDVVLVEGPGDAMALSKQEMHYGFCEEGSGGNVAVGPQAVNQRRKGTRQGGGGENGAGDSSAGDAVSARRSGSIGDQGVSVAGGGGHPPGGAPDWKSADQQIRERACSASPRVAVALLGLGLTDEKAALLAAKRPGRVIVAADAEPEAEARGRAIAEALTLEWGLDAVVGRWAGAKDAGAGARLVVPPPRRGLAGLAARRMGR